MTLSVQSRSCGLALLLLFVWHESPAQSPIPAKFRAGTELVLVPVTVTDHYGKTLQGLRAQDFTLFDDRVPQQILSLSSEDAPCSVGLILDASGSMKNALATAKDVAHEFLKTANSGDEFLLLTVSTLPEAVTGFSSDLAAVERSIDFTRPGGLTALIDTAYLGLKRMREARQPRRALLILTDGIENHSRYSQRKLMRLAIEADVQIYTIVLDNGLPEEQNSSVPFRPNLAKKPGDQAQDQQWANLLEDLAVKTGGRHFHARNNEEAVAAALKAGQAIRHSYVIGYRPPESKSGSKWHRIHVKLHVPDASVYARDGYYSQ